MRKAVDGGANWSVNRAAAGSDSENLLDVYFIDGNNGYVVGKNGHILKTTTGGV